MKRREYSTSEVAKMLAVDKRTLYRWLSAKRLPEPKQAKAGDVMLRVWTDRDVKRAADLKAQLRRGRPSKDEEVNIGHQLLSLHSLLNWYQHSTKLADEELKALHALETGLSNRLRERGLKW